MHPPIHSRATLTTLLFMNNEFENFKEKKKIENFHINIEYYATSLNKLMYDT